MKKNLLLILSLLLTLAASTLKAHAEKIPYIVLCWDETKIQYVLYFYGVNEGGGSRPTPSNMVVLKTYSDPEVTLKDWSEQPEWIKDLRYNASELAEEKGIEAREVYSARSEERGHALYGMVFDSSFKDVKPTSTAYWFAISNYGSIYNYFEIKGFENLNTSEVTNMTAMFYGFWDLELDFSTMDTRKVTSMRLMFADTFENGYEGKLDLSHFDTGNVTDMAAMFSQCWYPGSLDLSSFNTQNVVDMQEMFSGCYNLTELNVSSFNTSNVTNMSYMFDNCHSLQSLDVSNFDTRKVKTMYSMFNRCFLIPSLDLHNFNTSNVIDMGDMFSSMHALTSINVSSFDTSKATSMAYLFYGDENLTTLDLSSFNTEKVEYMNQMFKNSEQLHTIYVSNEWSTASVNKYGSKDIFLNCKGLVGGCGTIYNENCTDVQYAHIDMPNLPGYFTFKEATGIDHSPLYNKADGAWYRLDGRRAAGKSVKGIYVKDGKKKLGVKN